MWPMSPRLLTPALFNFQHSWKIFEINWLRIFMKCGQWGKLTPDGLLAKGEMIPWVFILA